MAPLPIPNGINTLELWLLAWNGMSLCKPGWSQSPAPLSSISQGGKLQNYILNGIFINSRYKWHLWPETISSIKSSISFMLPNGDDFLCLLSPINRSAIIKPNLQNIKQSLVVELKF